MLPRDLFNEADLLKMLGKLIIHIMDNPTPVPWSYDHGGDAFEIVQNEDDGSISCANVKFFVGREPVHLFRPLNSRKQWSLYAVYRGEEYHVFDSIGRVMPNFGFK